MPAPAPSAVSPARACAFAVVRRVFEQGAFADRALHAEAAGLDGRERALAMALAYGTVQRKRTLDHILAAFCSRRLDRLDPPVLAALRIGLFQLLFMDGIADHAAVHQSVELSKSSKRGGSQLVNAVLRRAVREGPAMLGALDERSPAGAALRHSVPDWIAELWWRERGPGEARALLAAINQPAEAAVRINPLRSAAIELPVPSHEAPGLPEGRVLEAPLDAFASPLWERGAIMPQSRGSMHVARVLAPAAGERVLDLCAAPGAKTTHLAALMGDQGEIVAVEVHPGRARALQATCERMGASCVRVECADAREVEIEGEFARVLIDPPCSGLGTLQSRPDLRWQPERSAIDQLAERQRELLTRGADALAPGGTLVYSVCTISRAEGEQLIEAWLATHPDFALERSIELLPHRDGTDGFFIARLVRG